MADYNKEYQAKVIKSMLELGMENALPSIEEIVLNYLTSKDEEMKFEEIVNYVSSTIGFSADDSIKGAVSNSLKKLKKQNKIVNTSHGYWQAI